MYWRVRRKFSQGAALIQTLFAQQEEALGMLCIAEERDKETRRVTRVARLQARPHYATPMPAPLFEAIVIHAGLGAWTVSGYERENAGMRSQRAYLQSWFRRPVTARASAAAGRRREVRDVLQA